jgi:hypothetical protein
VAAGQVADNGFDPSTWIFLGALAGATAAVLAFYGRAISGWVPPEPRTDLVTPDHFTRMRGVEAEVDLGRGWRSTDDPGAAWHLYWMPSSGDIVGLRTSELPPPPGPAYFGSVGTRSPLDPFGVHKFTGMKVLGSSGDRPTRAVCDELRPLPDGLDLLTGGTRPSDGDDDFDDEADHLDEPGWQFDDDV